MYGAQCETEKEGLILRWRDSQTRPKVQFRDVETDRVEPDKIVVGFDEEKGYGCELLEEIRMTSATQAS